MASRALRPSSSPAATKLAAQPGSAAVVGRGAETSSLMAALADADAGRGKTFFVAGESGIGKTYLVASIAEQAEQRGFTVAIGRAYPVESGVPYSVFSDALLPVLRTIEPSVLTLLTRGGMAELVQLFPALDQAARGSSGVRGDPSELKARLLWNFAQFLSRFAAKKPLLIVLENLQWADSASLEMLHFVARQISGDRILLIGTHNDPEHRTNPPLRAAEQSLKSLGNAQRIRLAPLPASAMTELLARSFGTDAARTTEFAERLHRWTGGNPFFIAETIKALGERGQLREGANGWIGWDVEDLHVPSTIREAVLARGADLGTSVGRPAEQLAVLGTRATHDELAAVSGLDHDSLISAIDELRGSDVLTEREDGADIVYDFSHPLLQETLYAEIGLARTRTLHGAIAEALERLYGLRAMAHAGELAFHYARGDTRPLASKAVEYLRAAGRNASAKYANREAGDYLTAALAIAEEDSSDASLELVTDLARVRQRLGDYPGALALWDRALVAARQANDPGRTASIARSIGLAHYWSGSFMEALKYYDVATVAAREAGDGLLEARVL